MIRALMLLVSLMFFAVSCAPVEHKAMISQSNRSPVDLQNKTWLWLSTVTPDERITSLDPQRYTLFFADNGNLQIKIDCNSGGGSYELSEGKVSFGPLFSTRMACYQDTQGHLFTRDLERVSSFFLQEGMLFLEFSSDGGTMNFKQSRER